MHKRDAGQDAGQQAQARIARRSEVAAAHSLAQLLEIERKRGYRPGWARHINQARAQRARQGRR